MSLFLNCNPGDALDAATPKFYRVTIVPATLSTYLWTDEQWGATAQDVPDMLNGTPLLAAQGAPTVITSPARTMVIDCLARSSAAGASLQSAVDALNEMEFDLSIYSIEVLPAGHAVAGGVTPQNQPAAQMAGGTASATTVAANSLTTELSSVGKMLLLGIALVAVIVVASKA